MFDLNVYATIAHEKILCNISRRLYYRADNHCCLYLKNLNAKLATANNEIKCTAISITCAPD